MIKIVLLDFPSVYPEIFVPKYLSFHLIFLTLIHRVLPHFS